MLHVSSSATAMLRRRNVLIRIVDTTQIDTSSLVTRRSLSTVVEPNPPLSKPSFDVEGKNFVVTGGTQGLGLTICRHLRDAGASRIAVFARTEELGRKAVDELTNDNTSAYFFKTDLSCPHSIATSCAEATEALERIDGLVNAGATTARGNLETTTIESFDMQMNINCRGPFLVTQAISNHMKKSRIRGSIVNISSVCAKGGAPFIMAYSASKAALECMTRNNAAELSKHGIRVNAVGMGWCFTDNEDKLQRAHSGENWLENADKQQPIGRILRPEDISATVGHLLSDAAQMMTGNVIDMHPDYSYGMISHAVVDGPDK